MKYRCNNAFIHYTADGEKTIAGGVEVDGDDPILHTHGAHFVPVTTEPGSPMPRTEVTTAAPGELRSVTQPKRGPGRRKQPEQDAEPAKPENVDESEG